MFYRGKHAVKSTRSFKLNKAAVMVASLVLLFTFVIGGTMAWLADETGPVTNVFTPGKVDVTIEENFDGTTKTDVVIKNNGNIPVYVRAQVVKNWVDILGNVYPDLDVTAPNITYCLDGKWQQDGNYWYYTDVLEVGQSTCDLIETVTVNVVEIEGVKYFYQIDILAEAVQSTLGTSAQAAFNAAAQG